MAEVYKVWSRGPLYHSKFDTIAVTKYNIRWKSHLTSTRVLNPIAREPLFYGDILSQLMVRRYLCFDVIWTETSLTHSLLQLGPTYSNNILARSHIHDGYLGIVLLGAAGSFSRWPFRHSHINGSGIILVSVFLNTDILPCIFAGDHCVPINLARTILTPAILTLVILVPVFIVAKEVTMTIRCVHVVIYFNIATRKQRAHL